MVDDPIPPRVPVEMPSSGVSDPPDQSPKDVALPIPQKAVTWQNVGGEPEYVLPKPLPPVLVPGTIEPDPVLLAEVFYGAEANPYTLLPYDDWVDATGVIPPAPPIPPEPPVPNYALPGGLSPHIGALRGEVKRRGRFELIDNPITPPTDADIDNGIKDSLSYLNRAGPHALKYSWDDVIYGDPRLLPIVYKIAQKLILEMLLHDWTHNGYDIRLEEFDLPSKVNEYQALIGQLDAEIERDLNAFKESDQKAVRGRSGAQSASNPLQARSHYSVSNRTTGLAPRRY